MQPGPGHRQCASAVPMVGITVTVSQYRRRWIASMFREDEDAGRHSFDETNGIWTAALSSGKFGIKDLFGDPLKLCPFLSFSGGELLDARRAVRPPLAENMHDGLCRARPQVLPPQTLLRRISDAARATIAASGASY